MVCDLAVIVQRHVVQERWCGPCQLRRGTWLAASKLLRAPTGSSGVSCRTSEQASAGVLLPPPRAPTARRPLLLTGHQVTSGVEHIYNIHSSNEDLRNVADIAAPDPVLDMV